MRKPVLMAGLALLFLSSKCHTQAVNWLTSFVPLWSNGNTNGNASNISGSGLDLTTTATISNGSFVQANGSSGAQTPTVAGATLVVPGSPNRIQIATNFTTTGGYATLVLNYDGPITNASFRIADIDKPDWYSLTDFDRVTITGSDGVGTILPTITRYDNSSPTFLIINGNVVHVNNSWGAAGNSASNGSDQRGTVNVNFGSSVINSIRIRLDNAPGILLNPNVQSIAIGNVSFSPVDPLPVTLHSFVARRNDDLVQLKWITSQEINSDYFEIQRSNSGNDWDAIGHVAAAGSSGQLLNYSYEDRNPGTGTIFYRLKEMDLDGRFKYSAIKRISDNGKHNDLQTYPNPMTSQVNVCLFADRVLDASVFIHNASSMQMLSIRQRLDRGNNNFMIAGLDRFPPGVYFLTVKDQEGNLLGHSRLIKQ